MTDYTLADFDEGQRVELSPATDAWVTGDRFGQVVYIGRRLVHVLMDRSRKVRRLRPEYIYRVL